MAGNLTRAILILGGEPLSADAVDLAESFDEVLVVERAVRDARDHSLADESLAYARAQQRLHDALDELRAHGLRATGFVGEEAAEAARRNAHELHPDAVVIEPAATTLDGILAAS